MVSLDDPDKNREFAESLGSKHVVLSDPKGRGRRNYVHAGALIDFLINTRLEPVAGKFPEFLKAARKARGRSGPVSEALVREIYDLSPLELDNLWRQHNGVRPRRGKNDPGSVLSAAGQ